LRNVTTIRSDMSAREWFYCIFIVYTCFETHDSFSCPDMFN